MRRDEDIHYMKMAVSLAGKGAGHVSPNPMVGAVIVKDDRVISRGWHKVFGGLHAETDALASCAESPAGATMYVTLEPCCHYGKQPPCTSAIIKAGISRVVVGMTDPNPLVGGKGISILREHGIEVCTGLLEKEIRYQNRIFLKYITQRRPWTVLKWAMTLDGRIAAASGDSRWVSCEESRYYVHTLRGRYMGIMAGIGTVLADNPMLNCRTDGMRQPVRIIVDSHASLPEDSAIVRTAGEYRTVLAHTADAMQEGLEPLRGCGIDTVECAATENGMVNLDDLMSRLGAMGIDSVLVEGGAELDWSLVSAGLADEHYIFVAPKIIGGKAAKGPVGGNGFGKMSDALGLDIESVTTSGEDILIHCFPKGRYHEPGHDPGPDKPII
ncbi:MAG: bifunctional diaminohydroxyphosphoribosylaminopyrimidine deaminase/5-amino-6-(5-phosphoribosylamino)uracil reductase RibD [Bacteroidetes bacterium]|uniref:Riboflavin biosynthesis protein RibD n=1 Tax=Candidatus Cryptobacteroides avicola TaxID=2840757 RepID=A0A940DUQ0_9BACT|nr:bifunctional diaminohydroxyphosphoribosylaminopyrimidine deaminase/5-amino-6-(5-phosphoribosylamino)uracil reductase RibD [Candidatus Cryptobacteroides avicola]